MSSNKKIEICTIPIYMPYRDAFTDWKNSQCLAGSKPFKSIKTSNKETLGTGPHSYLDIDRTFDYYIDNLQISIDKLNNLRKIIKENNGKLVGNKSIEKSKYKQLYNYFLISGDSNIISKLKEYELADTQFNNSPDDSIDESSSQNE